MPSFPEILRVQNPSKITKIIFVIVLCQRGCVISFFGGTFAPNFLPVRVYKSQSTPERSSSLPRQERPPHPADFILEALEAALCYVHHSGTFQRPQPAVLWKTRPATDPKWENNQEWTNHRIAKSGRFANFVQEPGFNLNSPTFSKGKASEFRRKRGLANLFVLDALLCCDGGCSS